MTFRWRTLCLVPAGSGCRFHVLLSLSLLLSLLSWHNDKLQVESWVNFVALSVSVDEVFLCLSSCPPGCHLLFAIWGAAQHGVAFEIDEAFVVLANEAQITRQLWRSNMRCSSSSILLFFSLSSSSLLFFFGCLSIRSGLASLFFCWILLNPTNSLRSFSFKAACTHWELIKRGIYRLPKNGLRPLWHHESQYTTK